MTDPVAGLAQRFSHTAVEDDPVDWVKNKLDIDLYSKQREILRLLERVPKLAVPSCHNAGKSFTAALAAARWLAKYPPGTARVITTAPTDSQVRAILWNEIGQLKERAGAALPGRVNQKEWWIGAYMAGLGRKPNDYAPGTFQGLHAEHILVILDEAGAIPNELWTGVDTLVTNAGAVILAIGNPDDPTAEFKRICEGADAEEGNGWTVVKIPAWETPNLSGEQVTAKLRSVMLSKEWVEDKRRAWGEDDPRWISKITAEFPAEAGMTVFRHADVQVALRGVDDTRQLRHFPRVQLGVDIAASDEGDRTVVRERVGHELRRRWTVQSSEPEDVSDLIVEAIDDSGATLVHVDATGVGFGFLADIRRRRPGVAIRPFVAAAQANDREQFENRRAEAHWTVRELLRKRALDLAEMDAADDTTTQLLAARYRIKKGKILVESKDEIRKRLGRSPDDSDAVLLSILPPDGAIISAPATAHATTSRRAQAEKLRQESAHAQAMTPQGPRPVLPRVESPAGLGRTRRRTFTIRARVY
jgi:hypothetical protein